MGEIKQTNFRIDQESADAFRKFCEENGWNQAEGFNSLITMVELNKAKSAAPGRAIEIESFEKLTKDIMAAYLNSIEINTNAEARIREQFAMSLDTKDRTISDLQSKMAELQEAKTTAEQKALSAAQSAAQAIKDAETAKEQADTATKLADSRANIITSLSEKLNVAESKSNKYDSLKESEEQKQREINKLQDEISSNKANYDREKDELKKEHDREINDLNKDHETLIKELKNDLERKVSEIQKDADLALEKAVSKKEREMMGQIRAAEKENAKLQAKIEILEARINELTAPK